MNNLPFITSCAGAAALLAALASLTACQDDRDGMRTSTAAAPGAGAAVDHRRGEATSRGGDDLQAHPHPTRNDTRAGTWNEAQPQPGQSQAATRSDSATTPRSSATGSSGMGGSGTGTAGSGMPSSPQAAVEPGTRPGAEATTTGTAASGDAASRLRTALRDEPSLSAQAKAVDASMNAGRLVVRGQVPTTRERDWILQRARSYAGAGMVDDQIQVAAR